MEAKNLVWGKVRKGSNRGKRLGFPTANIALHKNIAEGVYVSEVRIDGQKFQSLAFVGAAKTFAEKNKKVETYIFNFNKNIYGKWISIKLFEKIRGNIKFTSEKDLIVQMKKDLQSAKDFYAKSK
jgi:riboflavin kinase/FMN adenylyltransferase